MRAVVHNTMRVRAVVFPASPPPPGEIIPPFAYWLRVHYVQEELGDIPGTNLGYATRTETIPRLIILEADADRFQRLTKVIIAADEGYLVQRQEQSDLGYLKLDCSRISEGKFAPPDPELLASLT